MFSTNSLGKISAAAVFCALLAFSLTGPDHTDSDLSLLMEPDGTGVWSNLIRDFEAANPGVRVRLIEGPPATDTREDMYSTAFLASGSGYDIVYSDVVWVPKFAAAGWLLDLTDQLTTKDRDDFLPADLNAGTYHGRLYRVPAFTDAGILYYRKDLVPEPPKTFNELTQLARQQMTADRWGFLWQGKQYEGLVTVYLEVLWGFGGDWIDPETRSVQLDSPQAIEALEFLRRSIGTISPPAVTTYMEEDTRTLFQNGRAVFLRNWPYVWTLIADSPLKKNGQVGMTPVVSAAGHPSSATLGGWGFAISKFTRNPQAAWRFVKFLTAPPQLQRVAEQMGRIPARKSLVPADFAEVLRSARARPAIPEYAQASDILQRWLSAALTGRVSSAEALRQAATETQALLGM